MNALKKIIFAVDALPAAEAFLGQLDLTVVAFQALAMPVTVQDLQDETVHNVLVATRA